MNGFMITIENAGILLLSIIGVFAAFILVRIISKIVIKTYFQEKEKHNGKNGGRNSQGKIKK